MIAYESELEYLKSILLRAWNKETSADPDWSEDNPALGQCAVTALIVQDVFGGKLLRCMVGEVSHYYNELPNGNAVDFTWIQFDPTCVKTDIQQRSREYVLSYPETKRRYDLLCERVVNVIINKI